MKNNTYIIHGIKNVNFLQKVLIEVGIYGNIYLVGNVTGKVTDNVTKKIHIDRL